MQEHGYDVPTRPLSDLLSSAPEHRRSQLASLLVTPRGRTGNLLDEVPWPVVDVRQCHGDVAREFIKYLVKEAERGPGGQLELMDSKLFARIYEGLEGIRTVQAASTSGRRTPWRPAFARAGGAVRRT